MYRKLGKKEIPGKTKKKKTNFRDFTLKHVNSLHNSKTKLILKNESLPYIAHKRINPKSSHHMEKKKKTFFFYFF